MKFYLSEIVLKFESSLDFVLISKYFLKNDIKRYQQIHLKVLQHSNHISFLYIFELFVW